MAEREFASPKLEWWASQAPPEAFSLLIGGQLEHWRYRSRFVITSTVGAVIVARSAGSDAERRASLLSLARDDWRLYLGPDHEPLIRSIEAARPPPPPLTLEQQVVEFLTSRGVAPDIFPTEDAAIHAMLGRLLWERGELVSNDGQHRFFRAMQLAAAQLFDFGEPCLKGWMEEAEKRRGGRVDHVRRLRLSTFYRWAGQQDLAYPVSAFVEEDDFSLPGDARVELQLLSHRAALLLDLQDPARSTAQLDQERRRVLVATSQALLARAAPLQAAIGGPRHIATLPDWADNEWQVDPFEALLRRAHFAARDVGLL